MYQQQHFDNMQFNPMDAELLENNPELEELFPPFPKPKIIEAEDEDDLPTEVPLPMEYFAKRGNLLRYIIAMFDAKSPLRSDYPNFQKRQVAAAEVAGFEENDKDLQLIFDQSDAFVIELTFNYLREYAQSMLYAQIVANESVFWEYIRRMMKFSAADDDDIMKSKMGDELVRLQDRIETLTTKFFGDEKLAKNASQIKKAKRTSPEGWAKKLTNV